MRCATRLHHLCTTCTPSFIAAPSSEGRRNPLLLSSSWVQGMAPTFRQKRGTNETFELKGSSRHEPQVGYAGRGRGLCDFRDQIRKAPANGEVFWKSIRWTVDQAHPKICKIWHLCSNMTPSRCSFRPASSVPATWIGGFLASV